jgi:hypothetical protein
MHPKILYFTNACALAFLTLASALVSLHWSQTPWRSTKYSSLDPMRLRLGNCISGKCEKSHCRAKRARSVCTSLMSLGKSYSDLNHLIFGVSLAWDFIRQGDR